MVYTPLPCPDTIASPPPSLIPANAWLDFLEWARDGGYDESYFNRWDSKSRALEQAYLDECADAMMERRDPT